MRKIVVATHGKLALGIKDTVSLIAGEKLAASMITYCLEPGMNTNDYCQELEKEILKAPDDQYLILTDIAKASVVTSLIPLVKYPNVKLLTGINMAIVLELMLAPEKTFEDNELAIILQQAKEGMSLITKADLEKKNEDDF